MNLFGDYKAIEVNDKRKAALSKKMKRKLSGPENKQHSRLIVQLSVVIAAVLIFIAGLSYFSDRTPSTGHSGVSTQPQSPSKQDVFHTPNIVVKHLTFRGESKHWKAVNKVYFRRSFPHGRSSGDGHTFEKGIFRLTYKGDPPKQNKGKFSFSIEGGRRGTASGGPESFPKNGMITQNEVYGEFLSDQIKVTVQWNGKEETFKMTSQPEESSKKTIFATPSLSKVKKAGKDFPFMGIAGSGPFQVASTSWSEPAPFLDLDHKVPAYLLTDGKNYSQTVFLLFPDLKPSDHIIIVGNHRGESRTLFSGKQSGAYCPDLVNQMHGKCKAMTDQVNGKDVVPAVLQFGTPGLWNLTAYVNKKKAGEVNVFAYQPPTLSGLSKKQYPGLQMKGNTVGDHFSKFTAQWSKKNGKRYLSPGASLKISVTAAKINDKPLAHTFPILVVGTPLSGGGKPFIQAFDKSEVTKKDGRYIFDTTLPVQGKGKWSVSIYEGKIAVDGVTFYIH